MGGHILFKCPRTGMNVQHWLADECASTGRRDGYEMVICQACTNLHLIDKSSGKLVGEPEK
jgi:uncharacterized C2H2 Zn-finger protein